jgi:hypothetical protein
MFDLIDRMQEIYDLDKCLLYSNSNFVWHGKTVRKKKKTF